MIMADSNFIDLMESHDDENLILVLKKRHEYNSEAVNAAINIAIKRGLIRNIEELEDLYPDKANELAEEELLKKEELGAKEILYKNRFKYFLILNVIFYINFASNGSYYSLPLLTVILAVFNRLKFSDFLAKTVMFLTCSVPIARIMFLLADAL